MRSLALTLALAGFTLPASSAFAQDTSPGDEAPSERAPAGEAPAPSADLDLYREASLLLHRRDYAAAQARFEELLRRYPQSRVAAEARFWSATALEELGRKGEALAAYRALVAQHAQSGWSRDAAAWRGSRRAAPTRWLVRCSSQRARSSRGPSTAWRVGCW